MKQFLLFVLLCSLGRLASAQNCAYNFSSQRQLDALASSGCTTLKSLIVYGGTNGSTDPDKITNLAALAQVTAVVDNLVLVLGDVTDLQPLANIRTIGGNLTISASGATYFGINTFQSLESVGGDLTIYNSDAITAIDGFPLLRNARTITVTQNKSLGSIIGFNALQSTKYFSISQCAKLNSIGGFANLTTLVARSINEPGVFNISNNPLLEEIQGFTSLQSMDNFTIANNAALRQLPTFNNLRNVAYLVLQDCGRLTNISGFNGGLQVDVCTMAANPRLQSVTGFDKVQVRNQINFNNNPVLLDVSGCNNGTFRVVNVSYNPLLTKVSGFRNAAFTDYISVDNNPQLDSITGFTGASSPASLYIRDNARLRGFARGFAFSSYTPLSSLYIQRNPLLAACAQPWICDYLRRGRPASIDNNAASCTAAAITQSCQALPTQVSAQEPLPAYPNPVADVLHLPAPTPYTVRDLLGRVLLQGKGAQIRMADLPAGVYLVELGPGSKKQLRITKQ